MTSLEGLFCDIIGKYVALLFIMVQRASLVLNEAWHVEGGTKTALDLNVG